MCACVCLYLKLYIEFIYDLSFATQMGPTWISRPKCVQSTRTMILLSMVILIFSKVISIRIYVSLHVRTDFCIDHNVVGIITLFAVCVAFVL